jgi:hypothetical protein
MELFDHPDAEYSSSSYIREQFHRRRKIRRSIEFYRLSGDRSRDVTENEVLQIFPRDSKGNILKPRKKRLVFASSSSSSLPAGWTIVAADDAVSRADASTGSVESD